MRGLLERPEKRSLGKGISLRIMPAREELICRREGEELAGEDRDKALCANACVLARVLYKDNNRLYQNGEEVLEKMTAGQIDYYTRRWAEFDRECDPGPWDDVEVERTKKDFGTRLTNVCVGVCLKVLEHCQRRNERRR